MKKSFVIRIDPKLWNSLQQLAEVDFRSVNGEIEYILTEYCRKRGIKPAVEIQPADDSEDSE